MSSVADTIIVNASVLTMDPESPRAEAVAMASGRILAVGSKADVEALAGPQTQVIDAGGGTVMPGFSENHMHIFTGSAELDHLQLAGVEGQEALTAALRDYAGRRPNEKVLFAQGASYSIMGEDRTLDRQVLDAILPDRPVAIFAYDHHTMWTNTIGLERAGLLHGATLGPGNEIVMGPDGLANGELREMEAFGPLLAGTGYDRYRLGLATGGEPDPYPSGAEFEADIDVMRRGLAYCASHGITSIHNMDGNLYQLELLDEIRRRDGRLPCRVRIPFHFKKFMPLDALDKAEAMAQRFNDDELSSGLVKIFYDGVLEGWTATMVEPYADRPDITGEPIFQPAEFARIAVEADRRGLQIAVHAIGDGAVRAVLDGYELAIRTNGFRDARHRIEHVEVVHPDDIGRFAELGVIASMQPPHPPGALGLPLEPTLSRIGRARWPYSYAWRTLKDAGAHIPFASDWPVSPIEPVLGIAAAMTRRPWDDTLADQRLTLHETLAAYTAEGAWAEHKEDRKGVLKPGFHADIVCLDRNIESVSEYDMAIIRIIRTISGGETTYSGD